MSKPKHDWQKMRQAHCIMKQAIEAPKDKEVRKSRWERKKSKRGKNAERDRE